MAKSRIKRVRSAEGMRYYGLPMGSPITASAIKRAKDNNSSNMPTIQKRDAGSKEGEASHKRELDTPASRTSVDTTRSQSLRQDMVVRQGAASYTVPAGYTTLQPEDKEFTIAVSPSENVTLLTPSGIIEVDGEAADSILDLMFPDTSETPEEPEKTSTPQVPTSKSSSTKQDSVEGIDGEAVDASQSLGELPPDFKPSQQETDTLLASPFTRPWIDPETGYYTKERQALHTEIVERLLAGIKPPRNGKPTLYFNGGGPAAGKGTMTRGANARLTNYPSSRGADEFTGQLEDVESPEALLIDPYIMKLQLPEAVEALDRVARGVGSEQDKDWANSAHEESSSITAQVYRAALDRGLNIIFDGTGNGSVEGVLRKINVAKEKGYRVEANYISLDPKEGIKRALQRAKGSHRVVPNAAIANTYAQIPQIFDALKTSAFDKVNLFDNNVSQGQLARLIGTGENGKFEIKDGMAYAKFLASRDTAYRARNVFLNDASTEHLGRTPTERMASVLHTEASSVAPDTTRIVKALTEQFGMELARSSTSVASKDTLQRRIEKELESGKSSNAFEAGSKVRNPISYTLIADDKKYVDTLEGVLNQLSDAGYSVDVKNLWSDTTNPFNGVKVRLLTPSKFPIELQFHTQGSYDSTQGPLESLKTIYADTDPSQKKIRASLKAKMLELSNNDVVPKKITDWTFAPVNPRSN